MRSDGSAAVCDVLYFVVVTIVWIHVIIIIILGQSSEVNFASTA